MFKGDWPFYGCVIKGKRNPPEGHFPPLQNEGNNSNCYDILMWLWQRLNTWFTGRTVFVT